MIGTSLGRYQLLEPLGRGGMGEVYLAEDPALGRKVAVKVLPSLVQHDAEHRRRLTHEARAASALNHPNIVVIFDIGESNDSLFVAMEHIQGETLREWSRRARTPMEVLKVLRQATSALQSAHEAGLVHRDLKPENLMVRRDGLLKILDFGLARSVSPEFSSTAGTIPGTILGTAPYMSPEQVLGKTAEPASDLFSLGIIAYELLAGRHPFGSGSAIEIMHRILHEIPEPPSRVNSALSSPFDFVLAKALSKDPARRHASARDLGNDLETLECGCDPHATPDAARASTGPRSLAVLPFKNIGGDPSLGYLGMGFADAVITQLSVSPDLIVRATSAIARYQDQPVDARIVGQELQADVVLDASFQRAGDRLRATARLVDAGSGRSLWADRLDVRFEDMFDVQDQVARGIAEALTARLAQRPAPSSTQGTTVRRFVPSPEAYQHFMRGAELLRQSTFEGTKGCITEFEEALRIDPDYAQAWAQLGFAFHSLVDSGWRCESIWYEKSAAALARALALDPDDGYAHQLACAQHLVHGRKREAYRSLLESNRRLPHFWANDHYAAYLFRLCDMVDASFAAWEREVEVEPNLPWAYWGLSRMSLLVRREDEARVWMERLHARTGRRPEEWGLHMLELIMLGQFREILDRQGNQPLPESPTFADFYGALAHLKAGDPSIAAGIMTRYEAKASIDMDAAAFAASYYAHAGDHDRAFRYLDRAVELGHDGLYLYEEPVWFGPIHRHPRWASFIDGVRKRVEAYRREFRWPLPE